MDSRTSRGTIYLLVASAVFFISGYAIHLALGRYLGPEEYGAFGVTLTLMTTVNLLVGSGIPQAASKFIAEGKNKVGSIAPASLRIQLLFAILVFLLYVSSAGIIANILGNPSLSKYIRLSALAVPFYALCSLYCDGYLNGLRMFAKQSLASVANSLSKVSLAIGLAFIGLKVNGAILAYVIAAIIGWLVAWRCMGHIDRQEGGFRWTSLMRFAIPTSLFFMITSLIMSIDLLTVKAISNNSHDAGFYTAATNIARLPYYLSGALALALLPSISMSTSSENHSLTKSYISQSLRYMLIILVPSTLLISATSSSLVSLLYSQRYAEAAAPLSILIFGLALFSIFFVLSHVVMGSNRPGVVFSIAVLVAAIDVALNLMLVPQHGLLGAAWATTVATLVGAVIAAVYVLWRFGALVSIKSFARICGASAAVYLIARSIPTPPALLPLIYLGLFTIYLGFLALLKEFGKEDISHLRQIMPFANASSTSRQTK